MTELAWLLVGLLLGGCITMVLLCSLQLNRTRDYEAEIYRLKQELKRKE